MTHELSPNSDGQDFDHEFTQITNEQLQDVAGIAREIMADGDYSRPPSKDVLDMLGPGKPYSGDNNAEKTKE